MTISVIIPTLNEEAHIIPAIECACHEAATEVVVADGGSSDRTVEIAEPVTRVIRSPRGRATQMNHGAAAATGDVLVFLHADCRLPAGWADALRRAAARPKLAVGCFRLQIDSPRAAYRVIEVGVDLRTRWLGLPYGDQGLFMRRETFAALGGFPEVRLMEDLLLVRRARRLGRIVQLPLPIHVSARRWERVGPIRQTLHNTRLLSLALVCGSDPNRLMRFYPDVR